MPAGCEMMMDIIGINVAELEVVIRGINIAVKWNIATMSAYTDSATVYGWVQSVIKDSKRPKVSGLGEMLICRRLSMIAKLIETYNLNIDLHLVKSENNLADKLTRVLKRWLTRDILHSFCSEGYFIIASVKRSA